MVIEYRSRGNMIIYFQYLFKNLLLYFFNNFASKRFQYVLKKWLKRKRKQFPMPAVEPGPPGWQPGILIAGPCGILLYALLVCQYWKLVHNFYQFFFFQLDFTRVSPQESAFLHTHSARHSGSLFHPLLQLMK